MSRIPPTPLLPPAIRAVIELFDGPLAEIRFPDVDRESLRAAEAEVEQRRAELQEALEIVQAARISLESAQAKLLEQAQRAHAYASIYASQDPELDARLQQITLQERAAAPKKKRGRPAKIKAQQQTCPTLANDAA